MAQTPTILVVDDDPAIRKMLVEMLTLEGYPVEQAVNGREALEMLPRSGPRVVLLDLLMPEVSGRGVLETLAANPSERARHKIVLVSALDKLQENADLHTLSDQTLAKPFTLEGLMSVLEPLAVQVQVS
jgi:CheY-like chemotaxis protein